MPGDRLSVVLTAMANVAGEAPSSVDRVCQAAAGLLSVSGAGLSLMVDGQLRGTAGGSEPGVSVLQELQLALGEGPCVDAWSTGAAVVAADLANPTVRRWPAFTYAAVQAGVRAVFAFPLRLGAIRIGVLVLYRDRAGELTREQLAYGLVLADVATQVILGLQAGAPPDTLHELLAREPAHWAEIHQATGIVSVQLAISLDEAFVRLRARAFADGDSLRTIARGIVAGDLSPGSWH